MNESENTGQQEHRRKILSRTVAAVVLGALAVALLIAKPAMPDRIILLTGPEGSTYHIFGLRYAEELRSAGLKTEVVSTAGALDNMQRLAAGIDAVGFAPSTSDQWAEAGIDTGDLVALGSIGLEPLWLFHRADLEIERIPDLAGRTLAAGGTGSVTRYVARRLIQKNGMDDSIRLESIEDLDPEGLAGELDTASIDAVLVTGSPDSPIVGGLLHADGWRFLSFDRAEAYAALFDGIAEINIPEGFLDLGRNIPPQDAQLLATASCLVAHKDLHPAVVPMVLRAAEIVGDRQAKLPDTPAFPTSRHVTLPLDAAARRYFSEGETGLSKYLPYTITRYLNHLGFFVLPLLTAVVILLKVVPTALGLWMSIQLKRLFLRLGAVEKGFAAGRDRAELLAELECIDQASGSLFVPRSNTQDWVDFRQFLHDMRERVKG